MTRKLKTEEYYYRHLGNHIELTGNKCHQKSQIGTHESIPNSTLMLIQFVKRECNMDILNCDLTLETMLSLWRVVRFFSSSLELADDN